MANICSAIILFLYHAPFLAKLLIMRIQDSLTFCRVPLIISQSLKARLLGPFSEDKSAGGLKGLQCNLKFINDNFQDSSIRILTRLPMIYGYKQRAAEYV